MGVQGTFGSGSSRKPSHVAYYVALAVILGLLVLLLLYFFYFFINKIRKFDSSECITEPSPRRPVAASAYPVQPVVREGASEMAKLCKQLPPPGKGGTVFPTSSSPAALRTGGAPPDTAPPASANPALIKSVPAQVPAIIVESIATQ